MEQGHQSDAALCLHTGVNTHTSIIILFDPPPPLCPYCPHQSQRSV